MRYFGTLTLAAGALGISGLACSKDQDATPSTTLSAVVAPLDLPAATDVCYHLTVWNAEDPDEGEQVWDQPALCASQYGANNGIRFTGICDAQAGTGDADPDNDGKNAIRLILNDIYKDGDVDSGTALTAGEDYINPCPAPTGGEDNGCVLIADCAQNQDTKVEFNLTVMRQAELGFFDTVVKIHDVFCAAKLDCLDQNDEMLTYLPDPNNDNADGPTAVLGFTCLGGDGADINMYLDDIVITCGEDTVTIDPSEGPGHVGHTTNIVSGAEGDFVFGASVNTGTGFQGSRYWNVLIGMNASPSGDGCTLTTRGTVSEVALEGTPFSTPPHTRYPFIQWDVPLHDGSAPLTCERHPLNGGNGVSTEYSDIDSPQLLAHKLALAPPAVVCPCWDIASLETRTAAILAATGGFFNFYSSNETDYVYDQVYADSNAVRGFQAQAGTISGEVKCAFQDNALGTSGSMPVTAEELTACLDGLAILKDDPCAQANGGCGGDEPICVYDSPGQSHCVQCGSASECGGARPFCDLGEIYDRSPSYQMCVECGIDNLWSCGAGNWCDPTGTCSQPPTTYWIPLGFNAASSFETAQAACQAHGAFHMPSAWELFSAMYAQFRDGSKFFPGVVIDVQDTDHQFSPWRNYVTSTGNFALAWDFWGGSNTVLGWGGSWSDFIVCAPD